MARHGLTLGRMEHCQSVTKPRLLCRVYLYPWLSIIFGRLLLELNDLVGHGEGRRRLSLSGVMKGGFFVISTVLVLHIRLGFFGVLNSRTLRIRVGLFRVNEGKL